MPAVSKSQQRAAGMALAAKRGEMDVSELEGSAKEMYDSMTEKELEDFAETEHKGLPDKVNNEGIIKLKDLIESDSIDESFSSHAFSTIKDLMRMSGVRKELDDTIAKHLGRDWEQKLEDLSNDLKKLKL